MFQPIYNSLVAKYTPREHRSVCYGLNFVMGFGVGSLGAVLAGWIKDETTMNTNYIFAGLSVVASLFGALLIMFNHKIPSQAKWSWRHNHLPVSLVSLALGFWVALYATVYDGPDTM